MKATISTSRCRATARCLTMALAALTEWGAANAVYPQQDDRADDLRPRSADDDACRAAEPGLPLQGASGGGGNSEYPSIHWQDGCPDTGRPDRQRGQGCDPAAHDRQGEG